MKRPSRSSQQTGATSQVSPARQGPSQTSQVSPARQGPSQTSQVSRVSSARPPTPARSAQEDTALSWLWRTPNRSEDRSWSRPSTWTNDATTEADSRGVVGANSQLAALRQNSAKATASTTSLAFRAARWGLESTGHKGTTVHHLSERGIRFADVAHGVGMMRAGNRAQGGFFAAQAGGRLIGGVRGDQMAATGIAASQLMGLKGKGIGTKAASGLAVAWAGSMLLQDKEATQALQAPAMAGIVGRFAVSDAQRFRHVLQGKAVAPRMTPKLLRSVTAKIGAGSVAATQAVKRQAIKTAAGRQVVRTTAVAGSRLAGSAVLKAFGSIGPTGLIIRGHALAKAGNHAYNGRWKEAAISTADAFLFGDGSLKLMHMGAKSVHSCVTNPKLCGTKIKQFSIRTKNKVVNVAKKVRNCMRAEHRARCLEHAKGIASRAGKSIHSAAKSAYHSGKKALSSAYTSSRNWFSRKVKNLIS